MSNPETYRPGTLDPGRYHRGECQDCGAKLPPNRQYYCAQCVSGESIPEALAGMAEEGNVRRDNVIRGGASGIYVLKPAAVEPTSNALEAAEALRQVANALEAGGLVVSVVAAVRYKDESTVWVREGSFVDQVGLAGLLQAKATKAYEES